MRTSTGLTSQCWSVNLAMNPFVAQIPIRSSMITTGSVSLLDLFLSADINNYPGQQYTQPNRDIFGCFSDALPDRWGRLLLNRREQILATEEQRPVRKLSSFDYLMGIDDYSRMGGFRFKEKQDGEYINCEKSLRIPPLTDIRALVVASMEIENSEELNQLPEKKWLLQLVHP